MALTERPDLCLTVCQALRLLISKTSDNGKSHYEMVFNSVFARVPTSVLSLISLLCWLLREECLPLENETLHSRNARSLEKVDTAREKRDARHEVREAVNVLVLFSGIDVKVFIAIHTSKETPPC